MKTINKKAYEIEAGDEIVIRNIEGQIAGTIKAADSLQGRQILVGNGVNSLWVFSFDEDIEVAQS